jgi:hypothetical protein
MARESFDSLPPLLAELSDIIGLDATLELAKAKGGQRIAVPGKMHQRHWLAQLIGLEAAELLSGYVTDGNRVHLDIPFGPTRSAADRYRRTKALLDRGMSANEIAAATGVHRRTVFNRKRAIEQAEGRDTDADAAPDLFTGEW